MLSAKTTNEIYVYRPWQFGVPAFLGAKLCLSKEFFTVHFVCCLSQLYIPFVLCQHTFQFSVLQISTDTDPTPYTTLTTVGVYT